MGMSLRGGCVVAVAGFAGPAAAGYALLADASKFQDVTATHLPSGAGAARIMDAKAIDIDGDGDLDLALAGEGSPNTVLVNNGGKFVFMSPQLSPTGEDSEDIAAADFDGDGDVDLAFASEDTPINELWLQGASGWSLNATALPRATGSNAIAAADLDGDGAADLVLGGSRLVILISDGKGGFADETEARSPEFFGISQDLEFGDADGDGDLDLLVGSEGKNRLLINDGAGVFADETKERLPFPAPNVEETREADFGDVDGDGDLDIYFANVRFKGTTDIRDRLLINDGTGRYADESKARIPRLDRHTVDADFVDVDRDGDLDVLLAFSFPGGIAAFENDGEGVFTDATAAWFASPPVVADAIDIEAGDFDGDGWVDFYLTQFGPTDRLFMQRAE